MLASPGRRLLQAVFYAPRYRGIALREEINDLPQVRLSARTELCFLSNKVTSRDCLQIFEILCPFHFCSITLLGLSLFWWLLLRPLGWHIFFVFSLIHLTFFLCFFPYKPCLGKLSTQKSPKSISPFLTISISISSSPSLPRYFMDLICMSKTKLTILPNQSTLHTFVFWFPSSVVNASFKILIRFATSIFTAHVLCLDSNNLIKQNKDKNNYYKLGSILHHLHTLIFTPCEFVSLWCSLYNMRQLRFNLSMINMLRPQCKKWCHDLNPECLMPEPTKIYCLFYQPLVPLSFLLQCSLASLIPEKYSSNEVPLY